MCMFNCSRRQTLRGGGEERHKRAEGKGSGLEGSAISHSSIFEERRSSSRDINTELSEIECEALDH